MCATPTVEQTAKKLGEAEAKLLNAQRSGDGMAAAFAFNERAEAQIAHNTARAAANPAGYARQAQADRDACSGAAWHGQL